MSSTISSGIIFLAKLSHTTSFRPIHEQTHFPVVALCLFVVRAGSYTAYTGCHDRALGAIRNISSVKVWLAVSVAWHRYSCTKASPFPSSFNSSHLASAHATGYRSGHVAAHSPAPSL